MKPLKLVIQGIRSFTDKVEIDFEGISKNGLFGIFGSTGSGKSTILDSIIIALYGEISKRNMVEIINLRCKSAYVGLHFELRQNGDRRSFFVERTFKLKKDGSYGGAIASLYETTGGAQVVLASQTNDVNKKIEEVLGIGQSEFTKCIILPQGEFSQFVKSAKTDRVKIIEKLFSLERFGDNFTFKIKNKLSDLNMQIALKSEDLKHYEDATEEALKNSKQNEQNAQKEFELSNVKLLKIKEYIDKNQYFYNLYKQNLADSEKLRILLDLKGEIEDKKVKASLYESAEKIVAENNVLTELKVKKETCEKLVENLNNELEKQSKIFEVIERDYTNLDELNKKQNQITSDYEEMLSARGEVKLLNDLKRNITSTQAKINTIKDDISKYSKKIKDLSQIEEQLSKQVDDFDTNSKLSTIFATISKSSLKEEYLEQVEYYNVHKQKLNSIKEEGGLFDFVYAECLKKLEIYKQKLIAINLDETSSPDLIIKEYQDALNLKKELDAKLSSLLVERARLEEVVKALNDEVEKLENECELKKKDVDALNVKLLKIVDNIENFESDLMYLSEMQKSNAKAIELINKNYVDGAKSLSEIKLKLNSQKIELDVETKTFEKQKEKLNSLLTEEISSINFAKEILSTSVDVKSLNEEIEKFENDLAFYVKSVERLNQELASANFNSEEYLQKQAEKVEFEKNHENLKENLINCKNITAKLSQNFDKRCIIEKDLFSSRARATVFERLEQAVSRRAFSEFVSAEFLSDVARSARKILLELTGGKYDVVYKDSLDGGKDGFYILDNLNGGAERSVASLSGGETFLVSLSLALSLSASIYESSNRPMEFFFLDEGFGTLDENLVDTVLDSLEKLRNKNFSIGLISHLAEMKSRIDCKITVLPADETHGSRIIHSGVN